jgi:hypothetical protein
MRNGGFFSFYFLVREAKNRKRTMKNHVQQQQANYFDSAVGYYELELLDESEAELNKIDPSISVNSIPILTLRVAIAYSRRDWNKMKALSRQLHLLEPSNPKCPYSDGYAAAKIDSN